MKILAQPNPEHWLERNVSPLETIRLGLERIRTVAQRLNVLSFEGKIITVAGTNGKGSTCMMLTLLAQQKQLKVGAFMSPHIERFNERICINGKPVSNEELLMAFRQIKQVQASIELSYFEYATLAALWLFKQNAVDLMVLEVGLGGRLDAVNITDADCSIITSIALDHAEYLGDDLEAILYEKMGICRAGRPVIIGAGIQQNVALQQARINCHAYYVNEHKTGYSLSTVQAAHTALNSGDTWRYQTEKSKWSGLQKRTGLPNFQYGNMVSAVSAFNQIFSAENAINQMEFQTAVNNFYMPGRLQELSVSGINVLVDVAHNNQSLSALAGHLQNRFRNESTVALFSYLQDKQIEEGLLALSKIIDHWILYPIETMRGSTLSTMSDQLMSSGVKPEQITVAPNFSEGFQYLQENALKHAVAFGSFYVVNDIMRCATPKVSHGKL